MAKTHSQWSASASERNMACPGSLALCASLPPGETSIYAAWGTAMHTIIEKALQRGVEPAMFLGDVEVVEQFTIDIDEEMVEAATVCFDHVKALESQPGATVWLEEQFDLGQLQLPLQAGGTSDAVAWLPRDRVLEIVDYKGGSGKVVEIEGNTQVPHYGLGAVLKHPKLPVERVKMTIIQPRAPHKDGVIRSVEWHVSDLVDFANDILAAMNLSKHAIDVLATTDPDIWQFAYLHPGDHCQFCPAAGGCPALRAKSQEMVGMFWDEGGNQHVTVEIEDNSPETIERDLDGIEMIEQWIAARRAFAHQLAEGGHQFENWMLVERNGHRKWNITAENEAAEKIAAVTGLSMVELFTKKLKSPNQVEKTLGAAKGKIADQFHTPVIGTNWCVD